MKNMSTLNLAIFNSFELLSTLLVFMLPLGLWAQPEVDDRPINYQIVCTQAYWGTDDDTGGNEEPTFLIKAADDQNDDFSILLNGARGQSAGETACIQWDADAPTWSPVLNRNLLPGGVVVGSTSRAFDLEFMSYENDLGERCIADGPKGLDFSGDDRFERVSTLRHIKGDPMTWREYTLTMGRTAQENDSKIRYKVVWRPSAGSWGGDPIRLGVLNDHQSKGDFLSNRGAPSGADPRVGYGNLWNDASYGFQSSTDVTYHFTVSGSAKDVTISTDHGSTNYDTYVHLIGLNPEAQTFSYIEGNDDLSTSNRKSKIVRKLEPGSYGIVVEGKGNATGNYQLTVSAKNAKEEIPCELTDAALIIDPCDDNQTADRLDDLYGFSIHPSGTGLSGQYHVQGPNLVQTNVSYGRRETFSDLSINLGGFPIVIMDSENTDCRLTVMVTPPAPCSEAPLRVSPENPPVQPASGGNLIFDVTASGSWEVATTASWITLIPRSGVGNGQFFAILAENTSGIERSGLISVGSDNQNINITIRQEADAQPVLIVNPETPPMQPASGSNLLFDVTASGEWSTATTASWINLLPNTGVGNGQFFAVLAPNTSGIERSGLISVGSGNQNIDIYVTQRAGSSGGSGTDFTVDSWRFIEGSNPDWIEVGRTFKMEARIRNIGNRESTTITRAFYYLSTDDRLDDLDLYLTRDHIDRLRPNEVNTDQESITIPANIAPGVYYLLYQADAMEQVQESNEGNNVASRRIVVNAGNGFPVLCDDFETYANGSLVNQAIHWSKFAFFALDAEVTATRSSDYGKSLKMQHITGLSDQPEVLLKLGNQRWGTYFLSWKMYVPSGKTAYFDMQENEDHPGSKLKFTFHANGEAQLAVGNQTLDYDYPQDRWFDVTLRYEFDQRRVILFIDGTRYRLVSDWQLGAVHFHAINHAEFYVDEFCMMELDRSQAIGLRTTDTETKEIVVENKRPESQPNAIPEVASTKSVDLGVNLGQNYPNPVSTITTIPVVVPAEAQEAFVQITNMDGRIVRHIAVEDRGAIRLEVSAQDLTVGTYLYSLVVDGALIGTKRMSVVTQ